MGMFIGSDSEWECSLVDPKELEGIVYWEFGDGEVGCGSGPDIETAAINAIEDFYFLQGNV
jgi:hypothetical protein